MLLAQPESIARLRMCDVIGQTMLTPMRITAATEMKSGSMSVTYVNRASRLINRIGLCPSWPAF